MRRFSAHLLILPAALAALAAMAGIAWVTRDTRPIYATAALPPVGTVIEFELPRLGGDVIQARALRGTPTVLAFWSLNCGVSARALAGIEQLQRDYGNKVRVVVLADDGDSEAVGTAMRDAGITTPVALADGRLRALFDRSKSAPERANYRVQWAMPGLLVLDAAGRIAHRQVGLSLDEYRSGVIRMQETRVVIDSLLGRAGGESQTTVSSVAHPPVGRRYVARRSRSLAC